MRKDMDNLFIYSEILNHQQSAHSENRLQNFTFIPQGPLSGLASIITHSLVPSCRFTFILHLVCLVPWHSFTIFINGSDPRYVIFSSPPWTTSHSQNSCWRYHCHDDTRERGHSVKIWVRVSSHGSTPLPLVGTVSWKKHTLGGDSILKNTIPLVGDSILKEQYPWCGQYPEKAYP